MGDLSGTSSRLVPDGPRVVVRRGWRRGTPIVLLHLVAMAVVHVVMLPGVDRMGEAGDRALRSWMVATLVTAAVSMLVFTAVCIRLELGANRWVVPPLRSGSPPLPEPATGCLPLVVAILAFALTTFVEVLAAGGTEDAAFVAGSSLLLQLVGAGGAFTVLGWAITPGVDIVVGRERRGPADGGGGPTGPLLVASGVAGYASLLLAATLPAWLLGLPVRWWMVAGLAVVLVAAVVVRIVRGRRARPTASPASTVEPGARRSGRGLHRRRVSSRSRPPTPGGR